MKSEIYVETEFVSYYQIIETDDLLTMEDVKKQSLSLAPFCFLAIGLFTFPQLSQAATKARETIGSSSGSSGFKSYDYRSKAARRTIIRKPKDFLSNPFLDQLIRQQLGVIEQLRKDPFLGVDPRVVLLQPSNGPQNAFEVLKQAQAASQLKQLVKEMRELAKQPVPVQQVTEGVTNKMFLTGVLIGVGTNVGTNLAVPLFLRIRGGFGLLDIMGGLQTGKKWIDFLFKNRNQKKERNKKRKDSQDGGFYFPEERKEKTHPLFIFLPGVLVVILIIFGGKKLPEAIKKSPLKFPFQEKTIREKITTHLSSYLDLTTPKPYIIIIVLGGGILIYRNRRRFNYERLESAVTLGIEGFKALSEQSRRGYEMFANYTGYLTKSIDHSRDQDLINKKRADNQQDTLVDNNQLLNKELVSMTIANTKNTERLGSCKNDLGKAVTQLEMVQEYCYNNLPTTPNLEGTTLLPKSQGNSLIAVDRKTMSMAVDPNIMKQLDGLFTPAIPDNAKKVIIRVIVEDPILPEIEKIGIGKKLAKAAEKLLTTLLHNLSKNDLEGNMILSDLFDSKKANQETKTL